MNKIALLILCTLLCHINIAEAYVIDADWDKVEKSSSQEDNILDSFWWSSATLQIVQEKIQAGLDVNKSDLNGNTLLMLATLAKAKPDIVEKLINAGADINVQNNIGNTPLILATSNNNEELVKLFIKKNADLHIENDDGKTAFVYAYYNRNVNIFDILLNAGAKIEEINKHIGHDTVLTHVLADNKCSTQFIEAILRTNPDVNKIVNNKTPLMLAINRDTGWQVKSTTTFETIVPVVSDRYYERRQYKDEINLTNAFIQPNLKNDHRIPLINKLLEYGADVNQKVISKDNKTGNTIEQTALSHAVCNKQSAKLIKQLDNAGARDANALYCAILHNYDGDIIQSLLKPNLKPQQGLDLSLIEAVKQKKITLVKQLIQNGANVNGYDKEGKTALTHASPTIAKILKENGAFDSMDIFTAIDDNDLTKLESLIKAGAKLDIVKILNQNEKQEIRKVFYSINEVKGLTPLEYAAFTNKPEAVRLLIANGADINEQIKGKETNAKYGTLLEHIFTSKLQEVFAVFLEKSNINKDYYLWEAIRKGAETASYREGYPNILLALQNIVKAGANINAKNENGKTPLQWLLTHKELKPDDEIEFIAALLVELGADTQEIGGKENLLFWSMNKELYHLAKSLIKAGADVNARDEHGETPLFKAICDPVIVSMLINAGADVNAKDEDGTPLLFRAVRMSGKGFNDPLHSVVVSMLIKAGADVNAKDEDGRSLLHLTPRPPLIYLMLIKAGADVNTKDKAGTSPLWSAFINRRDYFVYLLVKAGARPEGFNSYEMDRLKKIVDNQQRELDSNYSPNNKYTDWNAHCEDNYCYSEADLPVNGIIEIRAHESPTNTYQEIHVKNGKKEMEKFYYSYSKIGFKVPFKGPLQKIIMYKDGKLDGMTKEYYKNGQLKLEATFKNGEKDGIEKRYYENGNLEYEVLFKNGKANGLGKEYHENGNLKWEGEFKNGELITEKEFDENGQLKQ